MTSNFDRKAGEGIIAGFFLLTTSRVAFKGLSKESLP